MISFETTSEFKTAEKWWRTLATDKSVYDLWELRLAYRAGAAAPLNFIAAFDKEKIVALLPLQFSVEYKCWEFFAEEFVEDNRVFYLPGYEKLIPDLYAEAPRPVKIYDLAGDDAFTRALPLEDYVYYLALDKIESLEDYLNTLNPKKKRNFRRDFRILEKQGKINLVYNRLADFDRLFELSQGRFGSESYLKEEKIREVHRNLLKLKLDWQMISLEINGELAAVSLAVFYNQVYYYLNSGADFLKFPECGNYLNRLNLERALALRAKVFNVGLGDCGWKRRWDFKTIPQYKYIVE